MASNQNNAQTKQDEHNEKRADVVKANINTAAGQGVEVADAARDGLNKMADLREQAAENTKQVLQTSVEAVSHRAREVSDRFTRTLGFSGEDSERLVRQSRQNMEAVSRCGTVLTQAFQDVSRGWFEIGQKQWQRNLDGVTKLTRARSVQEFTAIQSDLMRESLQNMVQDSKAITDTSARAVDEASKTFSSVAQQSR